MITVRRGFAAISLMVVTTGLAGCDGDGSAEKAAKPLCGIVDQNAAEKITGDAELTGFGGGNLDAERREGTTTFCQISAAGERRITVATRDFSGTDDRDAMLAQFAAEVDGTKECVRRDENPPGTACTYPTESDVAVVFSDRWVRVDAPARVNGDPPSTATLVSVAKNVDKNLTEHEKKR